MGKEANRKPWVEAGRRERREQTDVSFELLDVELVLDNGGRAKLGAQAREKAAQLELVWGHGFQASALLDVVPHDNDPVVISVVTAGRKVHKVLVDQGSSADVMFWSTFNKLRLSLDLLRPYTGCLYGFADNQVEVRGYLELRTTFTDGTASRTESIRYLVVNANSAYNILLGRLALNRLNAVASTRHMKMKLPDLSGKVIVIKSDQEEAQKCYENSLKTKRGVFMVFECLPSADTAMEIQPSNGATPTEPRSSEATPVRAMVEADAHMEEGLDDTSPAKESTPGKHYRVTTLKENSREPAGSQRGGEADWRQNV